MGAVAVVGEPMAPVVGWAAGVDVVEAGAPLAAAGISIAAAGSRGRLFRILVNVILPSIDVYTDFVFASSLYCSSECRYSDVLFGYFFETVFGFACIGGLVWLRRSYLTFCGFGQFSADSQEAYNLRLVYAQVFNPLVEDIPQMLFVCIDTQASDGTMSSEAASSYFVGLLCMTFGELCSPYHAEENRGPEEGEMFGCNPYCESCFFFYFLKITPPLVGIYWAMYWTVPVAYLFLGLPFFLVFLIGFYCVASVFIGICCRDSGP